ncbi:crotonase/enoyl-CoA hydratase family protein [Brevundimonas sp.]|uniref:crotonase/enoyl-CoA hydratase family protein n=1 Tax=Brevundimonas sp. TaxID=1871086 RepID=UPI00289DCE8C|nr:crotonase/enoyl-CoA hydratase family protein [Brevundimonas sp.]
MTYETLRYDVADHVATVTLSRPEKLNAFTVQMLDELLDVLDRIDADDDVRAAVITGDGRAFCAGADLSDGANAFVYDDDVLGEDGTLNYGSEKARDGGGRLTLRIFKSLKPMIAAINGPAVGIGATMTLAMDIRLASDSAKFGFVFARRGIVPEAASSYFLPRIVGISRALEWCFSGRVFDASEALNGGLVRSLHSPDELLPAAYAIAREIADNTAPVSVALTRQMMWRGLGMTDPMQAHSIDSRGILSRGRSRDVAEGVTAFLEKRPAFFPDRVSQDLPDYFPWWEEEEYR